MPVLKSVGGYVETQKALDFYKPNMTIGGEANYHPEAKARWKKRQAIKAILEI